jgi:UDP-N-acetylmuramate: L-alanyl-gamma-D-glutamyl-meso-diaminopimelate ligase
MQKVHFIGICNEAMHHLAIAVSKKNGFIVTGSDAYTEEPFYSRLKANAILPNKTGWFPDKIQRGITAIVVGPDISSDNPELKVAKDLGLKIYSYPEFIFHQTRSKTRIVIAGSQGKSSIAQMILHVLKNSKIDVDYFTCGHGACDNKAKFSYEARIAVIEGQDFAIAKSDLLPEFTSYKPHIAIITGIHHNDSQHYASSKDYLQAYASLIESMEVQGRLIYVSGDENLNEILKKLRRDIVAFHYSTPKHEIREGISYLKVRNTEFALSFFGEHQLRNLAAAQLACKQIGVYEQKFFEAFVDFKLPPKRLEMLNETTHTAFVDLANTPTKIKATLKALRKQFPEKQIIACYKLNVEYLSDELLLKYADSMNASDLAFVLKECKTNVENETKSLSTIDIKKAFQKEVQVFENKDDLKTERNKHISDNTIVVYMPEVF